jgi:hypothetical protein
VEERAVGMGEAGELLYGLDDTGLVVGEHDADEFGVRLEGSFEGCGFDEAGGCARQEGDLDTTGFESLSGVEDGVVLDGGGDEMRGFSRVEEGLEDAEECEVVALRAAGGEDDLGGAATEKAGDLVACELDGRTGLLALLMDGAGVAEVLDPEGMHGIEDLRKQRRGGVGVHVDAVDVSSAFRDAALGHNQGVQGVSVYSKQNRFYADWRDKQGRRERKAFKTEDAALTHEQAMKT